MAKRENEQREWTMNRRSALHTLVVAAGAASLGRVFVACTEKTTEDRARKQPEGTPTPTDDDEFVPGKGEEVDTGDAVKVPKPEWEARVKQLESEQARLFRGEVFTKDSAGVFAGKERSHVPQATAEPRDGKKTVVVVVQHVMGANALDAGAGYDAGDAGRDAAITDAAVDAPGQDAATDATADSGLIDAAVPDANAPKPPAHYITTIYLRATIEGVDTVVGLWEFAATDPAPPTVRFTLPEGVTSVTAYEWCTLHGLWASASLPV